MARHTMATVVCLSNGMPIESVSSVLGHKCISSTQIYTKITNKKPNKEMNILSEKLADIGEFVTSETLRNGTKNKNAFIMTTSKQYI